MVPKVALLRLAAGAVKLSIFIGHQQVPAAVVVRCFVAPIAGEFVVLEVALRPVD